MKIRTRQKRGYTYYVKMYTKIKKAFIRIKRWYKI